MDPIIEILPTVPERGLGVVVYTIPTNVRFFEERRDFWHHNVKFFDPFMESSIAVEGAKLLNPGNAALVEQFKKDRYGNIWAIFDRAQTVASIAILRGQQRVIFYPDLTMFDYDELRKKGKLGKSARVSIESMVS